MVTDELDAFRDLLRGIRQFSDRILSSSNAIELGKCDPDCRRAWSEIRSGQLRFVAEAGWWTAVLQAPRVPLDGPDGMILAAHLGAGHRVD